MWLTQKKIFLSLLLLRHRLHHTHELTLLWHTAQLKLVYCIYQSLSTAYQKAKNIFSFPHNIEQIDTGFMFRLDVLLRKHTVLSIQSPISTESTYWGEEPQSQNAVIRPLCTYSTVKINKDICSKKKKILCLLKKHISVFYGVSNIPCRVSLLPWFVTWFQEPQKLF